MLQSNEAVAYWLLKLGGVTLGDFTLSSGRKSPAYIDCRKLMSNPIFFTCVCCDMTEMFGYDKFDGVCGASTAGIPFATRIATMRTKPLTYVRKEPKGHGQQNQIEGIMKEGQDILLVDDLTTDGTSKLEFVKAIRATGATCNHIVSVF